MDRRSCILAAAAGLAAPWARAQGTDFPTHPIRLVVPFAAGGGTDVLARVMANAMSQSLGRPVIVDNVTGAGGVIGALQVAHAPADGYTLIAGTPGSIQINPVMQPDLRYDPAKDFVPVSQFSDSPIVLVVNKDTPWTSVQQLIDAARSRPGAINFGSAGVGSFSHFSAEMFEMLAKVRLTHVPYRGTAPALTDLRGGSLQVQFENLPAVLGLVNDGQLRALATGSPTRSAFLPNLPTLAEAGVTGYESSSWTGLFAPAATPPVVLARIEQAVVAAAHAPAVVKTLHDLGAEPVGSTNAAFRAYLARRQALVEQTVKASGMTAR